MLYEVITRRLRYRAGCCRYSRTVHDRRQTSHNDADTDRRSWNNAADVIHNADPEKSRQPERQNRAEFHAWRNVITSYSIHYTKLYDVQKCTVAQERDTIKQNFKEIEIEESGNNSITLF